MVKENCTSFSLNIPPNLVPSHVATYRNSPASLYILLEGAAHLHIHDCIMQLSLEKDAVAQEQ